MFVMKQESQDDLHTVYKRYYALLQFNYVFFFFNLEWIYYVAITECEWKWKSKQKVC